MTSPRFSDLGVSTPVSDALAARGIDVPFPVQELAIPDALAGKDVLVRSRTGSGKTLAFALPIVERLKNDAPRPAVVILVPTRELCSQVAEEFDDLARAKGLRSAAVYGGVSIQVQSKAAGKAHILIATPGRLEDISERRMVDLSKVQILVLDEADRMLDMGFQPQVDRIVRRIPKDRQTMFFSATLDGAVGNMASHYTRDAVRHEIVGATETVDEADHRFIPVEPGKKVEMLIEILAEDDRGLALVFVRTKHGADRLVHKLKRQGVHAAAMHGDMTQAAREKAFARFEAEHVNVLIATDVAARGLDLDNISHVINFDPPNDDKSYLHRVGRTARAGRSGTGVTFVQPLEQGDVGRMAARLKLHDEFQGEGMKVAPPRTVFSSRGRGSRRRR
ncbi:MAG: DEAD/DEAH box helicase [Actinomycetota bacterium]